MGGDSEEEPAIETARSGLGAAGGSIRQLPELEAPRSVGAEKSDSNPADCAVGRRPDSYKKWWKEPATADTVSHGTAVPERLGRV